MHLMRVERLYRYPVKGLTAERLSQISVTTGDPIPWDRAFALEPASVSFDCTRPVHLHKLNFLQLMKNEKLALLESHFDPETGGLAIKDPCGRELRSNVLTEEGRREAAGFIKAFMGIDSESDLVLHHAPNHTFSDARERAVSIINMASVEDLERHVGGPRHLMRFRANIYFSGATPWVEMSWGGRELRVGSARIRVIRFIPRCPATQVNPETGMRDADPVKELRLAFGHVNLGAFTEVASGGEIAEGDEIELV